MTWLLHAMLVPAVGVFASSIARMTMDVREGYIVEQLINAVQSNQADLVVPGVPRPQAAYALAEDGYHRLIAHLEENSIPVECLDTR